MNGRHVKRGSTWVVLLLAVGGLGCEQVIDEILDHTGHGHGGPDAGTDGSTDGGPPAPEQAAPMSTLPAGSVCLPNRWCYDHPRPHGLSQGPAWASSGHDIWVAAKYAPVVLHADADRWTVVDAPVPSSAVNVLRGGQPEQPWALARLADVNGMAVFRREGSAWAEKKRWTAEVADFFVAPDGDAWVPTYVFFGDRSNSTIERFDAATQTWSAIGTFPDTLILTVWASAPDDVWVAGRDAASASDTTGAVYHFDGATWTRTANPPVRMIYRIRGSGPDDVWIAGQGVGGTSLAHLVGGAWEVALTPPAALGVEELEVPAKGDVWAGFTHDAVYHASDAGAGAAATWNRVDAPVTGFDVAPTGAVTLVGDRGEIWFAATESAAPTRLTIGPRQTTIALWGTSPASQWVVGVDDAGAGALLHVNPTGVTQTPLPAGAERARAIWAADDDDIWIVGDNGLILHGSGLSGSFAPLPAPNADDRLSGLWGSGPDNVWIAGGHTLLRWNGTAFESPDYGGFVVGDVAGTGADDVWVVGDKMAHLHGGVWTLGDVPATDAAPPFDTPAFASDVWANGPDEIFVGTKRNNAQFVWRGDGTNAATAWSMLTSGTNGYGFDLFGAGYGDLWSMGPYISFHWDGYAVNFTDVLTDWDARYWGTAPTRMWAASAGAVLHRRTD